MKIVVTAKQVPDTETKVVIDSTGKRLDPAGVKMILNPYDEFAVEEALRIKEKTGEGEVIVLGIGNADSASALRSALAMGADRGILLELDDFAMRDSYQLANLLAAEIRELAPDLVLAGKIAIDDYGHQVPAMVAALLDWPLITLARQITLEENQVVVERDIEGGRETLKAALPCVITAEKGLNEPRYPSLRGIMQAKRKPLDTRAVSIEGESIQILEMTYPQQKPPGRIVGEGPDAVPELVRMLHQEAKVI